MTQKRLFACGTLLLFLLTACGKKEEPAPTPEPTAAPAPAPEGITGGSITLGKAVGPDKKVTAPVDSFAKNDTIYASVDTTGTGAGTLKAKWTYHQGGKVAIVDEQPQPISPTGPATTEFHVSNPKGWPVGDYQVEVFLDDKSLGVRPFTVK
jgi:hypothetical protein